MNNQATWVNDWTSGSANNWSLYVTNSAADLAAKNAAVTAANTYAGLTGSTFVTGIATTVGPAVAAAGTLTISGASGSGSYTAGLNDSAGDIAAGINATGLTEPQASARTETELAFGSGGASSGAVTLYVSTIGKSGTVGSERAVSFNLASLTDRGSLLRAVASFNNSTQQTGVSASLNDTGTALALTAADGSNIQLRKAAASDSAIDLVLGKGSTATLAAASNGALQAAGQVTLNSSKSFSLQTDSTLSLQAGVLGDATISASSSTSSSLKAANTLNVSTIANATQALRIADSALETVNGQRAALGALQNRFGASISNLQSTSENLNAARSRIRDTDFASETANLTRSQILQQAGTAILAQANALPNSVLTLLR
ncbi:MAG: flagellin [Burkholderiales bacterium]